MTRGIVVFGSVVTMKTVFSSVFRVFDTASLTVIAIREGTEGSTEHPACPGGFHTLFQQRDNVET